MAYNKHRKTVQTRQGEARRKLRDLYHDQCQKVFQDATADFAEYTQKRRGRIRQMNGMDGRPGLDGFVGHEIIAATWLSNLCLTPGEVNVILYQQTEQRRLERVHGFWLCSTSDNQIIAKSIKERQWQAVDECLQWLSALRPNGKAAWRQ